MAGRTLTMTSRDITVTVGEGKHSTYPGTRSHLSNAGRILLGDIDKLRNELEETRLNLGSGFGDE